MATLAFDFDDQLSEDWVSQPRSSEGALSPASPAPRRGSLLSRIPIPKKPAGANKQPSSAANTPNKPPSRPLHTKSKSELNISLARNSKGGAISPVPNGTPRSRPVHRRSSSVQSWRTDGTVQHFGSEVRHTGAAAAAAGAQMTPEWKKRLLKGQGADDNKDLFSSIGLEGVFRPLSAQATDANALSPKKRHALRCRTESSTIYPSSPPPYSSSRWQRSTNKSTSPSPLRDHPPHDSCTGQGGKCEGAKTPTPTPTHKKVRMRVAREEGAKRGRDQNGRRNTPINQNSSSMADHESISPVTISRGRIDYRTIQASVLQLRDKMQELGIKDQRRPSSRSSDHGINYGSRANDTGLTPAETSALTDECSTVPGPDEFRGLGSYVKTRRGGYSSDDNFYHKPLSSSLSQSHRIEAEPQSDTLPPNLQRTRSFEGHVRLSKSSPLKPKPGGSPLKLFGKHDTYTNNHLMRRLSQYVGNADGRSVRGPSPPSPSPRRSAGSKNARSKRFGEGKLNTYPFSGHGSLLETDIADENEEDDGNEPSLPPVLPRKDPVKFRIPSGSTIGSRQRVSRTVSKRLSSAISARMVPRRPSLAEFRDNIRDPEPKSDGKRTMLSPGKSHQPKRRRTLLSSVGSPEGSVSHSSDSAMPPLVIGKKRKDILPAEKVATANAKIVASRVILRPRSVSPQQSSSPASDMSSWLGAASTRQVSRQESVGSNLDQSTKILAEDLANFALNVAQSITKGERKASVTTADFFKEANIIMQHLRGQVPVRSGRTSGEISFIEPMPEIAEQDEPSSREQTGIFSAQNVKKYVLEGDHRQRTDSKLHKYKDQDENPFALDESVRNNHATLGMAPDDEDFPASDVNIRITNQPEAINAKTNEEEQLLTKSSAGQSTSRSIRTGSSGNSKKFNIAPETVKGLLSDHVGRMIFDHQKGVWVRGKSASIGNRPGSAHLSSDFTEDDPLKNIPDLEDNELSGVQHIKSDSAISAQSSNATVITRDRNMTAPITQSSDRTIKAKAEEHDQSRPSSGHEADSSQFSKLSKFGSSQAAPDTRATSWSTQPSTKVPSATAVPSLPQIEEIKSQKSQDSVSGSKDSTPQRDSPVRKPSVVAFSSPLTTVADEVLFEKAKLQAQKCNLETGTQRTPQIRLPSSMEHTPVEKGRVVSALARNKDRARNHLSIVKQRYSDRPVSRIEERDEHAGDVSILRGTSETSMILATPQQNGQAGSKALLVPPPSTGRHSSVAFHRSLHLDILSDFTIHQVDESLNLDVNYVRQRHNLSSDAEVDSQFSLAVRELVARVTDIEPFEPYWEYISRLELSGRKLVTLHMLEDFCPRIEELDVDQNELGQLNGAPDTLRSLSVRKNCLTNVTAWGHLRNLHYLDASNNGMKTFKGFESLVHLRELTLNNNRIDSLEGLENLREIIKLRLRGNSISKLDLCAFELPHLVELDLSDNEITEVIGLDCLPKLERLYLHGNRISKIDLSKVPQSLTFVDLSRNHLTSLDISSLTSLTSLNVDGNCLATIDGMKDLQRLSALSWQAQNLPATVSLAWTDASEVRELALSGNKLDLFQSETTSFPNMRCLDLSCCGLDNLPANFGRTVSNVRYLNLNYNGLRDIKPLIGACKLKELHLAGNRIKRLRNTAAVLERIGKELEMLDLRNNGLTLGFYAATSSFTFSESKASDLRITARESSSSDNNSLTKTDRWLARDSLTNVMSSGNSLLDRAHRDRLDESTSMRRRVFELLAVHHCPRLMVLDGLGVCEENLYGDRDRVWNRLVELKIVKAKAASTKVL